jgi:hypothetical protein
VDLETLKHGAVIRGKEGRHVQLGPRPAPPLFGISARHLH